MSHPWRTWILWLVAGKSHSTEYGQILIHGMDSVPDRIQSERLQHNCRYQILTPCRRLFIVSWPFNYGQCLRAVFCSLFIYGRPPAQTSWFVDKEEITHALRIADYVLSNDEASYSLPNYRKRWFLSGSTWGVSALGVMMAIRACYGRQYPYAFSRKYAHFDVQ